MIKATVDLQINPDFMQDRVVLTDCEKIRNWVLNIFGLIHCWEVRQNIRLEKAFIDGDLETVKNAIHWGAKIHKLRWIKSTDSGFRLASFVENARVVRFIMNQTDFNAESLRNNTPLAINILLLKSLSDYSKEKKFSLRIHPRDCAVDYYLGVLEYSHNAAQDKGFSDHPLQESFSQTTLLEQIGEAINKNLPSDFPKVLCSGIEQHNPKVIDQRKPFGYALDHELDHTKGNRAQPLPECQCYLCTEGYTIWSTIKQGWVKS